MSDTSVEDRCRGVQIGLAAGDRIGGPIRMAVSLAESLLDCGGFAPADILDRCLGWWREGSLRLNGWDQEEDRRRSVEAGYDHHHPVGPKAVEGSLADLGVT